MRKWLVVLVLGGWVLSTIGCGTTVCGLYCANAQKLIFVDATGAPLTPRQVTDTGVSHWCADPAHGNEPSVFVTCTGNELTYDMRNYGPHFIRAEATSGEVFAGDITPQLIPGRSTGSCSCGTSTLTPLTLQLSAP